jgi:hypothetical protein
MIGNFTPPIQSACRECERMWFDDATADPSTAIDFIEFMETRGLSTSWEYVQRLS